MSAELTTQMEQLGKNSRRSAVMSFFGLAVLGGSLLLAGWQLQSAEVAVASKTQRVAELVAERQKLEVTKAKLNDEIGQIGAKTTIVRRESEELERAVTSLLFATLDREGIRKIAPNVDWNALAAHVRSMRAGPRKTAVLIALLTTWRKVPQRNGGSSLETGMDSPRFLNFVLEKSGLLPTQFDPQRRASVTLMQRFHQRTEDPEPGDLMFYATGPGCAGDGNPACMYVAPGKAGGRGVCVGVPFYRDILQVLDSQSFPAACQFLGYFRVPYEKGVNR